MECFHSELFVLLSTPLQISSSERIEQANQTQSVERLGLGAQSDDSVAGPHFASSASMSFTFGHMLAQEQEANQASSSSNVVDS